MSDDLRLPATRGHNIESKYSPTSQALSQNQVSDQTISTVGDSNTFFGQGALAAQPLPNGQGVKGSLLAALVWSLWTVSVLVGSWCERAVQGARGTKKNDKN